MTVNLNINDPGALAQVIRAITAPPDEKWRQSIRKRQASPGSAINRSNALTSLIDIPFRLAYTSEDCVNFATEFYEPSLAQVVPYDRTIYTFSTAVCRPACWKLSVCWPTTGASAFICRHKVTPETHTAIMTSSRQAERVPRQVCRQGKANA